MAHAFFEDVYCECEIKRSSDGTIEDHNIYRGQAVGSYYVDVGIQRSSYTPSDFSVGRERKKRIIMYVSINNPVLWTIDVNNRYDNSFTCSIDTSKQ